MGHRANLVLVSNGDYELFYCHWCANTITGDIFWGPQYAIPYVRSQKPVDHTRWLDNVFSEGGVLIDTDQKVLLVYGGEWDTNDIPEHRVYLDLLREIWSGWEVRWAFNGLFDLAAHISETQVKIEIDPRNDIIDRRLVSLNPPPQPAKTGMVGSFIFENDELRLFPLFMLSGLDVLLIKGLPILEMAHNQIGQQEVNLSQYHEFPRGGFHVDMRKKQLMFWALELDGLLERIIAAWPGWDVIWLEDKFEAHLAVTRGRLVFPFRSEDALLGIWEAATFENTESSASTRFLEYVTAKQSDGHDVKINPDALREDPLKLSPEIKRQIRDIAVSTVKQKWADRSST